MPYIQQEIRELLWESSEHNQPSCPGELNYMFSQLCRNYIDCHGLSYQNINDIIGALEGAKIEFYRRVAAPYESEKAIINGDVYNV